MGKVSSDTCQAVTLARPVIFPQLPERPEMGRNWKLTHGARNLLASCLIQDKGSTHTGSAADIVQGKLSDLGVLLEEKRKRLANATSSTKDGNLGELLPKCMLADDEGCHRGKGRSIGGEDSRCGQRQRKPCAGFWKPT
ncbi:hypothetical protein J3459_022249 [Metarhizium acridum]|nr:hypothetical protein J3459_022249 [Metarhizium acridum]